MLFDTTRKSLFQLDVESFVLNESTSWASSPNITTNLNQWKHLLKEDANSLYINTLLTLSEALLGIANKTSSWPTVKLYYVLFYVLKVELYLDDVGVFRDVENTKSLFVIDFKMDNCTFQKGSGRNANSDHYRILNIHKTKYSDSDPIYSQSIDSENIPVWMRTQREIANYKQVKFEDPNQNDLFAYFDFSALGDFAYSNTKIYLDTTAMAAIPITKCIQVRKKIPSLLLSSDTHNLILKHFLEAGVPENIVNDLIGTTNII